MIAILIEATSHGGDLWGMLQPVLAAGGGAIAAYVALVKARPEGNKLSAEASKVALEVFKSTVLQLQADLAAARGEMTELTSRLARVEANTAATISTLTRERDAARSEVVQLQAKVAELEGRIRDLENPTPRRRRTSDQRAGD